MNTKTGKNIINKKINIVLILTVLLLFVTIAIPSFCMLLTKDNSNEIDYWDGSVAASFNGGSGGESDPYIISNGKELAYLASEVNKGNSYDGKYFKLTNNIHLNNGVIEYKNDVILYTRDSIEYYVKPFTNEYYKDNEFTTKVGTINIFPEMKLFRGNVNGNDKFIYGLYLTNEEDKTVSLIEEQSNGKINNLYFSNTLLYGNHAVSLINSTQNGTYSNLIFNGHIHSEGLDAIKSYNLDAIEMTESNQIVNITIDSLPEESYISKICLKGTTSSNVTINNNLITNYDFEIEFTEIPNSLNIQTESIGTILSNLTFEISYNTDSVSALINNLNNSRMNNILIRGNVDAKYIAAPLIAYGTNNLEINNSFNDAKINGKYIAAGFIGVMENASINMGNIYNSGDVIGEIYAGGIFGAIYSSYNVNLHDSFNVGTIIANTKGAIAGTSSINIIDHNNYYTNEGISPIGNNSSQSGTYVTKSNLLQENFLSTTLKFTNTTWNVSDKELPKLITFDSESPNVTIKLLDNEWTNINTNEIIVNEQTFIQVEYEDLQSDILKVEYHIGNKIYTETEINNLEFNLYEENILLKENGKYYIVFKVTDVVGNIKIATTDLIKVDGYNLVISDIYNKNLEKYDNQISSTSTIKYNFSRIYKMDPFEYNEEIKYYLESNIQLPKDTNIKLIDNINNKIYSYIAKNNDGTKHNNKYIYELSLFKEFGIVTEIYFDNKVINYYQNNKLTEDFSFIFDFKKTDITNNQNFEIDLVTIYNNNIYSRTYTNQSNKFILAKYDDNNKEINYSLELSSNYNGYLNFSEIGNYDISLENNIITSKLNNKNIYDSNFNVDNLSLNINITDSNNEIITGNLVNGLSIEYNDKEYFSNDQGIINIPFYDEEINIKLKINYIINDINNGIYYLNITSCDGDLKCSQEEKIPINILNNISNLDCDFLVDMDDKDRLIIRNNGGTLNNKNKINLDINYIGTLSNPNVRIKLYKKLNFDSNNQVYELVDISQYISNNLEIVKDYEYYLVKNLNNQQSISLDLLINNFQYGGYKFEFNLYDGESFVQKDIKNILVK